MPSIQLPPEIIGNIISFVDTKRARGTLAALALASHACLPYARDALYGTAKIDVSDRKDGVSELIAMTGQSLAAMIATPPHLARVAKEFQLTFDYDFDAIINYRSDPGTLVQVVAPYKEIVKLDVGAYPDNPRDISSKWAQAVGEICVGARWKLEEFALERVPIKTFVSVLEGQSAITYLSLSYLNKRAAILPDDFTPTCPLRELVIIEIPDACILKLVPLLVTCCSFTLVNLKLVYEDSHFVTTPRAYPDLSGFTSLAIFELIITVEGTNSMPFDAMLRTLSPSLRRLTVTAFERQISPNEFAFDHANVRDLTLGIQFEPDHLSTLLETSFPALKRFVYLRPLKWSNDEGKQVAKSVKKRGLPVLTMRQRERQSWGGLFF